MFSALIFIATAAYSGFSGWQLSVLKRQLKEMRDSSVDTHELAIQAKNQADAAKAQSEQASRQVDGITRLADETKRQANIAHDALKASMQSAAEDRRPWVGLQLLPCNGCSATQSVQGTDDIETFTIGDLTGFLINTGRTPATNLTIRTVVVTRMGGQPMPDASIFDEVKLPPRRSNFPMSKEELDREERQDLAIAQELLPPTEVLAPNATRQLALIGRSQYGRKLAAWDGAQVVYVVGKITYSEVGQNVIHSTTFCILNRHGAIFRFCPSGNKMD